MTFAPPTTPTTPATPAARTPAAAAIDTAGSARPTIDWSYGALWRAVPRGLGYLIPTIVIAIVVSAVLNSMFSGSVGLILLVIGVPFLLVTLLVARWTGAFEVVRLRAAGHAEIVAPEWRFEGEATAWRRLLHPLANGHYWLSLLHGAIIAPVIATLTFTVLILWLSVTSVLVLLPLTLLFGWNEVITVGALDDGFRPLGLTIAAVLGVIAVVTLPYVVRASVWLHAVVARPFLGRFKSEQLERQVSSLFSSRQAAVAAEGTSLRRIERDIHDGPQQRLIRLQMDLAAAERRIDTSPEEARDLITAARRQAQDALDELRALSRGFAPPLLMDRGLFAALESLATRSSIPVTLQTTLGSSVDLPDEVARTAYFTASELIANVAKHSGATSAVLAVSRTDTELAISVSDDGQGGAIERTGHGLAGLRERSAGLGGTIEVVSPDGGPTTVTVTLPALGTGQPGV